MRCCCCCPFSSHAYKRAREGLHCFSPSQFQPLIFYLSPPLIKECNKSKSWIPIKQKQFEKSSDKIPSSGKRKQIKKNRNQNVEIAKKSITENNIKSFCRHWIHVPTSTCVRHCNVKKYISYWMFHDFIVLYVILYRIALCSTFSVFYIRTQSVHTVHSEHTHI